MKEFLIFLNMKLEDFTDERWAEICAQIEAEAPEKLPEGNRKNLPNVSGAPFDREVADEAPPFNNLDDLDFDDGIPF